MDTCFQNNSVFPALLFTCVIYLTGFSVVVTEILISLYAYLTCKKVCCASGAVLPRTLGIYFFCMLLLFFCVVNYMCMKESTSTLVEVALMLPAQLSGHLTRQEMQALLS